MSGEMNKAGQKKEEKKPKNNHNNRQNGNGGGAGGSGGGAGGGGGSNRDGNNGNKSQKKASNRGPPPKSSTKVDMRKYDKMIHAAHDNFSDIPCEKPTDDCVICCKPNNVFGVGDCRHPICVECAIRMRVLGESKTCPVCRAEIETLTFCTVDSGLDTVKLSFPKSGHPDEERFGIRFSSKLAGTKYEKYLAHVCKICDIQDGERLEFPSFVALRQHMATKHQLSYCHICTDNLNLFSRERKTYTREQLQRHMRIGDFDDKSFKGHPQCLFCEQKFLDAENRYRHLRKDHFFCQFCESDGTMTNVFFEKHPELKAHYKEKHFVCTYPECDEMGIAFAAKFDLDLHKAKDHAEKRNFIGIAFGGVRPTATNDRAGGGQRGGRRQPNQQNSNEPGPSVPRERIAVVQRQQVSNPQSDPSEFTVIRSAQSRGTDLRYNYNVGPAYKSQSDDFPHLGGSSNPPAPTIIRPNEFPRLKKVNKTPEPAPHVEEYPSLGNAAPSNSAPISMTGPVRLAKPIQIPKKRTPPKPAPPPTPARKQAAPSGRTEEDFEEFTGSMVPQTTIKVHNKLVRVDMVDRPESSAQSNVKLVKRVEKAPSPQSSQSARAPSANDFPSLPPASANSVTAPANSEWLKSQTKKKGLISSVTVPSGYAAAMKNQTQKSNKKSKKANANDVWSSLGRVETPPIPAPAVEEWQDIPLSKEAQAEKEKKEKKDEWARRKAEIRAAVAAASSTEAGAQKKEEERIEEDSVSTVSENPSIDSRAMKNEESERWQEVKRQNSAENRLKENGKKNKNKKKQNQQNKDSAPVPAVGNGLAASKNVEKKPVDTPVVARTEVEKEKVAVKEEVTTETFREKVDALWNMPAMPSMTSFFNNFSFFGGGGQSAASSPNGMAPPPGLENVIVSPPLGFDAPKTVVPEPENMLSFKNAPFVSQSDTLKSRLEEQEREKAEKMLLAKKQQNDENEEWQTAGNNKNKNKKKSKK